MCNNNNNNFKLTSFPLHIILTCSSDPTKTLANITETLTNLFNINIKVDVHCSETFSNISACDQFNPSKKHIVTSRPTFKINKLRVSL